MSARTEAGEIARLCANVTDDQRDWMQTYTFRDWPEWFLQNRIDGCFALDGTDEVPNAQCWWRLIAYWYKAVSGNEPPELTTVTRN